MKHYFIAGGLACVAIGLVPAANASIEPETVTYSAGYTPYGGYSGMAFSAGVTESVPQFNPSLGTLNSVTFSLTQTISGTATFWNSSAGGTGGGTVQQVSTSSFYQNEGVNDASGNQFAYSYASPSDGTSLLSSSGAQPAGISFVAATRTTPAYWSISPSVTAASPDTVSVGYSTTLISYILTSSSTADASSYPYASESSSGALVLGEFEGTGSLPLTMTAADIFSFTGGTVGYSSDTTVSGSLSVSYDYTPSVVPEPGTWMAAGLLCGVVGLHTGRSLWRRKTQPVA